MNARRKFNSIARRIHRHWQWQKLRQILLLNALALLAALAAYLYARETAVTGAFAGWDLPRELTADGAARGLEWLRSLTYRFTWQGLQREIPLAEFVSLAEQFGKPLLITEGVFWLFGFFGGARDARKLLRPLDRMAETAQRLTDEVGARRIAPSAQASKDARTAGVDEEKFHHLEDAIGQIGPDGRLSTGDKDLKGLEDAINDLLERMQRSYRQQTQFVSDASHELRTPIAVIQGYAAMLDRWGKDDPKVLEESIAAIRTETEHMKALVEQLLFLARGDSGRQPMKPETLDLSKLMDEVLEEYRMIDAEHVWRRGAMAVAPAMADPALIKQAARVLADNAVRYTPSGGTIRLSADSEGGEAWFEIQDSGIGIDEADVPHIFDRFFRADPARARQNGGTGLGLSIAAWIVERHGGHFEVLSRPGIGTRIRVILPAEAPMEAPGLKR